MLTSISNAISLAQSAAPREFRLFKRGMNATLKGDFNFDDAAASSVMAAYHRHGIDLMVDLEHDSLSAEAKSRRSDAADARGWFELAVKDGELWAVNVRWTPDGERRLSEKTQRYISPAFLTEGNRITEVVNCALCAYPATHAAPALVAASRSTVVGFRVTPSQRAALYLLATQNGVSVGELIRRSLIRLAAQPTEPACCVSLIGGHPTVPPAPATEPRDTSAIAEALGLPPDATRDELLAALEDVIDQLRGTPALPEAEDPGPVLSSASFKVLSSIMGCSPSEVQRLGRSIRRMCEQQRRADTAVRTLTAPIKVITLSDGRMVTLSASEIESCEAEGAKFEDYARNKATREAARSGASIKRSPVRDKFELNPAGKVVMKKR